VVGDALERVVGPRPRHVVREDAQVLSVDRDPHEGDCLDADYGYEPLAKLLPLLAIIEKRKSRKS
jgi:hypothetical protein